MENFLFDKQEQPPLNDGVDWQQMYELD